MPSQAKYSILIPTHDNLKNELIDLPSYTHEWLYRNAPGFEASYIEGPKRGNWKGDPQETFHHLITVAPDTPEMDSYIKQAAAHVGDLANQWGMFVHKEGGKNGIQSWVVNNSGYKEGEPARAIKQTPPQVSPMASVLSNLFK